MSPRKTGHQINESSLLFSKLKIKDHWLQIQKLKTQISNTQKTNLTPIL